MALKGIRVVEFLGLAPGPFCGRILADFGATVTVVRRAEAEPFDVLSSGKRNFPVNLKCKEGVGIVTKLCISSDVVLDTFRPGVLEKLGMGPDKLLKLNPKLIYARLTGYGQTGFFKNSAGHDINYAAMSGILSMFKKKNEIPTPPPFIADFAGGGSLCALSIILALFEREKSGLGQVIDLSMTEGSAYIGTWLFKSRRQLWTDEAGRNILDGGYAFYGTYKTKDDKFMAVGAVEPQFYSNFLKGLNLSEQDYPQSADPSKCRAEFQAIFLTKTQKEWSEIFETLDACVTPVLDIANVEDHKHNISRKSFYIDAQGCLVPDVAPRLSRTKGISIGKQHSIKAEDTAQILKELGYSNDDINSFIVKGYIKCKL